MFIKIDEEESSITINTDQIVWAEAGDHNNQNMTTFYFSDGKSIKLSYMGTETVWKAVGRKELDKMMTS